MAVVTVAREYGSRGFEIAVQVCRMLGYRFFDDNLLVSVASEMGFQDEDIVHFSEDNYKVKNFLERILSSGDVSVAPPVRHPTPGTDATAVTFKTSYFQTEHLNEQKTLKMVQKTIQTVYKQGNVVIVGRGGQVILKDKPGVLRVRIEAPLEERVRRVSERDKVSSKEAKKWITEHDENAERYIRRFYNAEWKNPLLYHMVFNTQGWDLDAVSRVIVCAVSNLST